MSSPTDVPLPDPRSVQVVVEAPGAGPGNWAGAPSAVLVDRTFWLTYRVRRPLEQGRGVSVVVARSVDGVSFETVAEVTRERFGCESFERPVVLPTGDGRWRLYLSCATPGSKHWWVDSLTADTVAGLPQGEQRVVLAGDPATVAVKDPVILREGDQWQMWLCCHPLTEPGAEDRMSTAYLTSLDGLTWTDHGTVLTPRPGNWDARGVRVTTVVGTDPLTVLYDGRPDAESNWYEVTGVARGGLEEALEPTGEVLEAVSGSLEPMGDAGKAVSGSLEPAEEALQPMGDAPWATSPHSDGALRYAAAVPLLDGSVRFYAEMARPDGAHDLVTSLWQRSAAAQ